MFFYVSLVLHEVHDIIKLVDILTYYPKGGFNGDNYL